MTAKAQRKFSLVLLVGWLFYAYTLTDFPLREARYFEENRATMREIVVADAMRKGNRLSESEATVQVDREIAAAISQAWRDWIVRLITIVLGIGSVLLYLWRVQRASWFVGVTSLFFVGVWLQQFGTTNASVAEAYVRFATGVFETGSLSLKFGFALFNVVLPFIFIVSTVVFAWSAVRGSDVDTRSAGVAGH